MHNHTGAWAPSDVVELVTRFARRLSQDVPWPDIEALLVLINQVSDFASDICPGLHVLEDLLSNAWSLTKTNMYKLQEAALRLILFRAALHMYRG